MEKAKFITDPYGFPTTVEEKVKISQMFEFIAWKDTQILRQTTKGIWYTFEVSNWISIGDNIQLWNKFKQTK